VLIWARLIRCGVSWCGKLVTDSECGVCAWP